ncbi:DUF2784 domain-containing protein [Desertivirga brevis]|uniref:DUF2784 domain-containing protein n=1 Tax=Desertivirga brevis TaxID=2810310 RepID=UPI001A96F95B|nr:DUF2784 domain-containing protein [Pedobacter sp. SYSU D00873]
MLQILDVFFTLLHLVIILFNLFGWLFPKLLKYHLLFALVTLGCWFVLGIWYGIGYCPITDWQWQIKEKLGERDLPASFIKYLLDRLLQKNIDNVLVDWLTGLGFGFAVIASIYLNIISVRKRKD